MIQSALVVLVVLVVKYPRKEGKFFSGSDPDPSTFFFCLSDTYIFFHFGTLYLSWNFVCYGQIFYFLIRIQTYINISGWLNLGFRNKLLGQIQIQYIFLLFVR